MELGHVALWRDVTYSLNTIHEEQDDSRPRPHEQSDYSLPIKTK